MDAEKKEFSNTDARNGYWCNSTEVSQNSERTTV